MYFTTPEHPKARIQHQCSTCHRIIEPGETYHRGRGYDGGEAETARLLLIERLRAIREQAAAGAPVPELEVLDAEVVEP